MKLGHATADEVRLVNRLSYAEWDPTLGPDRFEARERLLGLGWWPPGKLESWVLRDDDGTILSSCETYRVPCTHGGRAGTAWEVASVFTEPGLRGRGHAAVMLRDLAARLGGLPGATAMVLFSDIGAEYYARLGYAALPAWDRVLHPEPGDLPDGVRLFSETELVRVHVGRDRPGFDLPIALDRLDWHLDRARVRAELTGRPRAPRCGAERDGDYVVWAEDGDQLRVLLLEAARHGPSLLRAAAVVAEGLGLTGVRGWETEGWPGEVGAREPRKGGIPMLLPLAAGVEAPAWGYVPRAVWV